MKMINGGLTAGASSENIFGPTGENEYADRQENGHDCPEEGHEDDAASSFEDSR